MSNRKKSGPNPGLFKIVSTFTLALGLVAGGCGNNMARMEENQLRLQAIVEMNATQIGKVAQRIEENQQTLQEAVESVRSNTQKLAGDIASVVGEHVALQKSVRAADAAVTAKITAIEHKQGNLHTLTVASAADINALGTRHTKLQETVENDNKALAGKIGAIEIDQQRLQTEIENAQAGIARVTTGLNAIADAHAKLAETAKIDNENTNIRISDIDQKQTNQQDQIETVGENVLKIAAEIAALDENLIKLQEVLQNDTQNLADVIEMIGQGQIDFEGKVERDYRKLADSVRSIEQNQAKLANQAATMQTSTQTMINDLAAALDTLKTANSVTEVIKPPKVAKTKTPPSEQPKP